MKLVIWLMVAIAIVLFTTVFGAQNTAVTSINLLVAKIDIEVRLVVAASILFGAILATVFWFFYTLALKAKIMGLNRKLNLAVKNRSSDA